MLLAACDDSGSKTQPLDTQDATTGADGETDSSMDTTNTDVGLETADAVPDLVADLPDGELPDTNDANDANDLSDAETTDVDLDTDGDDSDANDKCIGGTLCGQPATCCPAGNECIANQCLVECPSGVRCGADQSICCGSDDVCISALCATPTVGCQDSYDCQPGEFCEPTLQKCLPQPNPLACELVPTFEQLQVAVEWTYAAEQVISPPFVADIDGDGVQEVVLNATQTDGGSWPFGKIVVVDGQTGLEEWRIEHDPTNGHYGSHGRSSIGLADVSGDGLPDIVYATRDRRIVAVSGTGALLWVAHDGVGNPVLFTVENGAATLANFDADPEAEVVFGATLIDNDGLVVWNEGNVGPNHGTNGGYTGGISAVADLDGDHLPEIVSGREAWKVDWQSGPTPTDPPTVNVWNYWTYAGLDGYPAVADLDLDGVPEVILVASGFVIALNGQTGTLWCGADSTGSLCANNTATLTAPYPLPGGGIGGPPTVADFDDDYYPEVGVAGAGSYSVYDFARPGEAVVQPVGDPVPAAGAIFARWSHVTQDQSSNTTGSSVFDFQGDGNAEVVYADECYLRVYSGTDGTVQLELQNHSATIHEYPIVVDVDSDGNSEILIVSNGGANTNCSAIPGYNGPNKGLFVFGDVNDEWVPTRKVWPQHAYHVTNATSDGNVPLTEVDNWSVLGLNNYRQNVQGEGVFNAPDLAVDLSLGLGLCVQGQIELLARVTNVGALGVPAGVAVAFFEGTDATGLALGTGATTVNLLPGGSTVVTLVIPGPQAPTDYFVVVDNDATGSASVVVECDESNNEGAATAAMCIIN